MQARAKSRWTRRRYCTKTWGVNAQHFCMNPLLTGVLAWLVILVPEGLLHAATVQARYYAHPAVQDRHGVIAPWYGGLNGQVDFRIGVAAETLKRYPWTTGTNAIAEYPAYVFSGFWQIATNGIITPRDPGDWGNGDMSQRATSVLNGLADYYRYSGDAAAIAHITYMADYIVDHCQTPPEHPWPGVFVSVPVKGKAFYKADPQGMIQLDLVASTGHGLLRAWQLTGNARWFETAKHWGDLLAERCNLDPKVDPWPRYANPEVAPWKENRQTGGVTMMLAFLDELIRLGHTGRDNRLLAAREAGVRYLRDRLLPAWFVDETWGRYFWDWPNPNQNCLTTPDAAAYLLNHRDEFPNWRCDARNILTLFLNHTSVAPESGGDVYSGAWAYPESSACCGRSLWYAPFCVAPTFAHYAELAEDPWMRELAYRQLVLQTYDGHPDGRTEDNIDGGIIVNGDWFNIAHPLALRFLLAGVGWLPEELGANRENHIVRATAVIDSVLYGDGRIEYTTFDAPAPTIEVLRLAFVPRQVMVDGRVLKRRRDLDARGYTVKPLENGDAMVSIRHDGARGVVVTGDDPQRSLAPEQLTFRGDWQDGGGPDSGVRVTGASGNAVSARFTGNQVRVIGRVGPDGGLADVYLDGARQLVHVDCWNPTPRDRQVLFHRSGLAPGAHTLELVARGAGNPHAQGTLVRVHSVQCSDAEGVAHFPSGRGPRTAQRMVFGYTGREDYRDSVGRTWRPGTELVTRGLSQQDSVGAFWWTQPVDTEIAGTRDPELYRYGVHGRDFRVHASVGPGRYYARLKFAVARGLETAKGCFDIRINGQRVVERLDVAATAGGANRAVDLVFNDVISTNGVIEIRFTGRRTVAGDRVVGGEAYVQALEIGPGRCGKGAKPVSLPPAPATGNRLSNPGFEDTRAGAQGGSGVNVPLTEWTGEFLGPANSYIWQEADYIRHPDWGLPELRSGTGAIRTHSDAEGHTRVYQDVEVEPNTRYTVSAWVRAADLHGRGFGRHKDDSAGLIVRELDVGGQLVQQHAKVEIKSAGPYRELRQTFVTSGGTAQVRFILDTVIHCRYTEGHVTYDDCELKADRP